VTQDIARLGLKFDGFVATFRIATHSWVYENHRDWLVPARLFKIIDDSLPAAAPAVTVQAAGMTKAREVITFAAQAVTEGVPALGYHWNFGEGAPTGRARVTYIYTNTGSYNVRLTAAGVDGLTAKSAFSLYL